MAKTAVAIGALPAVFAVCCMSLTNGPIVAAAPATPASQPQSDAQSQLVATFEQLVRLSHQKIDYYEAILRCRSLIKAIGTNESVDMAIQWAAEHEDKKLLNLLGSDVIGDNFIAHRLVLNLSSTDTDLQKTAREYFAIKEPEGGIVPAEHAERASELADVARQSLGDPTNPVFAILFKNAPRYAIDQLAASLGKGRNELDVQVHKIEYAAWFLRRGQDPEGATAVALTQLDQMSRSEQWWIRAYAAEMLRRYEVFRTEAIVTRLQGDNVPFVASLVDEPFYLGIGEQEFLRWKRENPLLRGRY